MNGGRIAGNGGLTLAASADFEWLRGQFSFTAQVPSSLTIQSGATVNIRSQNEHVLSGRRLFNHGVINFNDGGGIVAGELNFGLTNEIAGVINITAPGQTLRGRDEPGSDVQGRSTEFINRGLVNRIGLPGDAIWRPHSFSNRGNLNIQSGNIRVLSSLSDALSSQTTLEIGSALIVAGGSFEFLTGNTTRSMVTAPS